MILLKMNFISIRISKIKNFNCSSSKFVDGNWSSRKRHPSIFLMCSTGFSSGTISFKYSNTIRAVWSPTLFCIRKKISLMYHTLFREPWLLHGDARAAKEILLQAITHPLTQKNCKPNVTWKVTLIWKLETLESAPLVFFFIVIKVYDLLSWGYLWSDFHVFYVIRFEKNLNIIVNHPIAIW